jgi:outer membrane lipoprotein-sorting protein
VAATIGLIALVPNLSASAAPNLPSLTPQQLIVKVQQANVKTLSGSLKLTSNLGLPNLGSLRGVAGRGTGFNPIDLLTGSNQAKVWLDGPQRVRIAVLRSMAESDFIQSGQDVWTWDSTGSKVQHTVISAGGKEKSTGAPQTDAPSAEVLTPHTPDQAAKALLDHLNPSTAVSVTTPAKVAGRSVYELVLTPRTPQSTIDHAGIAVDAKSGLPLQVSLFAKGQKKPALQLGFTSISLARPAASNFTFKTPPGATVTANGAHHGSKAESGAPEVGPSIQQGAPVTIGQDWTSVVVFRGAQLPRQADELLSGATVVNGAFGSGRLLQTSLINVLFLNDGRIAAGAVTPSALEAAVASAH